MLRERRAQQKRKLERQSKCIIIKNLNGGNKHQEGQSERETKRERHKQKEARK